MLGAVGEYFRKFVGIIYLSEDKSTVIISHNTFLGHRRDREVKVENIIPLSETPENPEEISWRIVLYSGTPRSYYICTRFGGILNQEEFAEIFGAEPK